MRFANEIIGAVAASLKGVGIIHCTLRFARIENAIGFNSVVRQGLSTPEEANRVAFRDGHLGGRKAEIRAVNGDDNRLWLIGLWFNISLHTTCKQNDRQQHQEGSHVQK